MWRAKRVFPGKNVFYKLTDIFDYAQRYFKVVFGVFGKRISDGYKVK